jgi:hypothetical protein
VADGLRVTAEEIGAHSKLEWEPLFPAGFYERTLTQTRAICVDGFSGSKTRPAIMAGLESLLSDLSNEGIECEVWVDGSFLTKKPDAADADVVVRLDESQYGKLDARQRGILTQINGPLRSMLKKQYLLDLYVFVEYGSYPEGHPKFGLGEWQRAYWIRQFGRSRGHNKNRAEQSKGMIRVRIPLVP